MTNSDTQDSSAERARSLLREEARAFRLAALGSPRRRRPRKNPNAENIPPDGTGESQPRIRFNRRLHTRPLDNATHINEDEHQQHRHKDPTDENAKTDHKTTVVSPSPLAPEHHNGAITPPGRPAPMKLIYKFSCPDDLSRSLCQREHNRRKRIYFPDQQAIPEPRVKSTSSILTPEPTQGKQCGQSTQQFATTLTIQEPVNSISSIQPTAQPVNEAPQTLQPVPNRRSLGQQKCRLREQTSLRQQKILTSEPTTNEDVPNRRSLGQQRRRLRERTLKQQQQLPTAEPTQDQQTGQSTQQSTMDANSVQTTTTTNEGPSRRSLGQQRRRLRERTLQQQSETNVNSIQTPAIINDGPSRCSLGQQRRRLREQMLRQQQLLTLEPIQGQFTMDQHITWEAEPYQNRPQRQLRHCRNVDSTIPLAWRPYQEPAARHDLGRMDRECQYCGALHWLAEKLTNSSDQSPEFPTCCDHGTVDLPDLQPPPPQLASLFIGTDRQAKNFRDHIWDYNRALSFTSLGVDQDHDVNRGHGQPVFRIHGELCHRAGALLPSNGCSPTYAQLYILDSQEALRHRMQNNRENNLREDTMDLLQQILRENHQYAAVYLHTYEILRNHETEDICIRLRVAPGTDRRRYNLPTADEVAVILPGDQSTAESRDIILRLRGGGLQQISECHPAYAPLQYVLLFPCGDAGWHPNLRIRDPHSRWPKRKRVTLTRHTAYRIHDRQREFSCLLRGGRLFQRYLVDMWAAADQNNLRYLRHNQNKFRTHISQGLEDAIDNDENLNNLGSRVILPSSYPGGPRHMQQRFQDSLAIARYFKKVDIFLTMTCNARWPEIQRELRPHETAYDRPDLVSRVFQMKKKALLEDILDHGVLGHVVAHVYTIEFQKRGLPHMHLLLFFHERHKLFTPKEIDKLISAKWPNPDAEPLLFETVKSCMVHGPCGAANPKAPCMDAETNRCTKRFPKDFKECTNMDVNGYPEYSSYRPHQEKQLGSFGVSRWSLNSFGRIWLMLQI